MRIDRLDKTLENGKARVSATVTWEDCDRPARDIWFITDEEFAGDIEAEPNAFLLGSILFAMRHGERRVRVDGTVCPRLRTGLNTAMLQLRAWYGEERHRLVAIEAAKGFHPPIPAVPPRAACFLSGGVDSMATLRRNRLDYPLDHPGSIKDGFFIQGFDFGAYEGLDLNNEHFEKALKLLSDFGRNNGVECIPIQTNLRHLDDDDDFFHNDCFGAALAAIPHLFTRRMTATRIPASGAIGSLYPQGSHPLLDPNYSSASLEIIHDGARLTRQERVVLVGGWDQALRHLRSCYDAFRTDMNCGKCEKCLRTMTALLVAGKLKDCTTYPVRDLAPEHLDILDASPLTSPPKDREELLRLLYRRLTGGNAYFWRDMRLSLCEIGRHDLAEVIGRKLTEFVSHQPPPSAKGWRGAVKRFDRRFMNGSLMSLRRRFARD